MALQENVGVSVRYKAHSTGAIISATLPTLSSDPGSTGGQVLRRVSSSITPSKDTYQSNEVRTSRQVFDMRHGLQRVAGDIAGELSPGTYTDHIEALLRCTKVATFSVTQAAFTSLVATNSTSKLTVAASTWAAQNFRVGDLIRVSGASVAANNRNFVITALSGVDATVYPAPTDMTADTTFAVDRMGDKMFPPLTGHVSRKYLYEHYHETLDVSELFSECRVHRGAFSLPATGLATTTFSVQGRGYSSVSGGSAPFFTSPTAVTSSTLTAAVNGLLTVQGTAIGVITGLDFTIDLSVEAPAVVGQNYPADIILGRTVVTGNVTALFDGVLLQEYFTNETEVDMVAFLASTSSVTAPGVSFYMSRVKFQGANKTLQGEGSIPITLPFQALERAAATGYDATTITICDNAV